MTTRKRTSAARRQLKAMVAWAEPIENALGADHRAEFAKVELVRRENITAALALAAEGCHAAALRRLTKGPSRAAVRRATGLPDHIVQLMLGLNRARLLLSLPKPGIWLAPPVAPRKRGKPKPTILPGVVGACPAQACRGLAPIG